MKPTQQQLIFFSPTGTTQSILSAIAEGTGIERTVPLNLTLPAGGSAETAVSHQELAIIGAPVYGGRIPLKAIERLQAIRGEKTPAVIAVVYGNRAFEDALLELRDLAIAAGFIPVAAAAFIGEHSFATDNVPIAANRPDAADLEAARRLGRAVADKLSRLASPDAGTPLPVPGNSPYKQRSVRTGISPETNADTCTRCGTCEAVCPTNAVVAGETVETETEKCIICCACVKNCPSGARTLKNDDIRKIREWLQANFSTRKDPEIFV